MSNKQNEDPPLSWIHPERAMVLWGVSCVLILVATVLFLHFAKIPEEPKEEVSLSSCFLIAQAPPYLYTKKVVLANLSAYNPVAAQCDSTPDITASGKKVRAGYVANNCLPFGTIVEIDGKHYEVQDRMNRRYGCKYFDILMWNEQEARTFGRQIKEITYYKLVI